MANTTNMDSGVDFELWNNSDEKQISGAPDKYSGTQGISSRDANDDSLQTSDGTWVIVFDQSNYKGNCWQIDEGEICENLHDNKIYDSSGNDTGNHWQGTINSFILYKQKPSWFVANSSAVPSNDQLFELHDSQVLLCEDAQYQGNNSTLEAPYTCLDTSSIGYATNGHIMSGAYAISSLKTGPSAWLVIYDHSYMAEGFKKIAPNSGPSGTESDNYSDLNNIADPNVISGDWNDQINSFLIYNYQPEFWNTSYASPYVDFTTLFDLYPYPTNDVSDNQIVYEVEDSKYTIDCPALKYQSADQTMTGVDSISDDTTNLPTTGWTKYHVHLEHDNTMAWNDTADFDLYFDNAGNLVQIANFTWTSNGAFDVPETIIKSVDLIAWYLGTTGALETMGISEEAADTFVDIFNFVCNAFNKIAGLVYKFTDNGGEFYFLPVICHTLNRVCATVAKPYNVNLYSQPLDHRNDNSMSFIIENFPQVLENNIENSVVNGWEIKQGSTDNSAYNQVVEYNYLGCDYRTWYQESSVSGGLGMFVSCKIDYEITKDGVTDDSQDDHIILLMGFCIPSDSSSANNDSVPTISFAQAIVQFTDGSNDNIITPAYNSDAINQVTDALNSALATVKMDSNQQGRKYIAEIAKFNMTAMSQCAYFGE